MSQSITQSKLDFRKFGKIIGKDISWEESERKAEERIRNLKEPPLLQFYYGLVNAKTSKSIKKLQRIIDEKISTIKCMYMAKALEEKKCWENSHWAPPSNYEYPIETIEVEKKNPFSWIIKIQHTMPPKQVWYEDEERNDEFYEKCIKKDDNLFANIHVYIYRVAHSNEYVVNINRVCGHSMSVYDFAHALEKKVTHKRNRKGKGRKGNKGKK